MCVLGVGSEDMYLLLSTTLPSGADDGSQDPASPDMLGFVLGSLCAAFVVELPVDLMSIEEVESP